MLRRELELAKTHYIMSIVLICYLYAGNRRLPPPGGNNSFGQHKMMFKGSSTHVPDLYNAYMVNL